MDDETRAYLDAMQQRIVDELKQGADQFNQGQERILAEMAALRRDFRETQDIIIARRRERDQRGAP